MSQEPDNRDVELRRLHAEADARERDIDEMDARDIRRDTLIDRLRREAAVQAEDFAALTERLEAAEHELEDLRAVRDALTPAQLPERPGLELAATFIPASAEQVSGDFYLVAEGPQGSTVLVVGDVVGHGLQAGRRAAFVRTAFAATAPFSDDPSRLLSWANTALIERAGTGSEFVTAACVTYLPHKQLLRWAYAGHPPALSLNDGGELVAPAQGTPLGIRADPGCIEGSGRSNGGGGLVLYTDGLTEARHGGQLFGLEGASAALSGLDSPSPTEAIGVLRARAAEFAHGILTDDICLLAARIT
ncbi:MAG: PP2C family protein-serine/threonine phosphatase [Solirubrobacteraceae bacterium]